MIVSVPVVFQTHRSKTSSGRGRGYFSRSYIIVITYDFIKADIIKADTVHDSVFSCYTGLSSSLNFVFWSTFSRSFFLFVNVQFWPIFHVINQSTSVWVPLLFLPYILPYDKLSALSTLNFQSKLQAKPTFCFVIGPTLQKCSCFSFILCNTFTFGILSRSGHNFFLWK